MKYKTSLTGVSIEAIGFISNHWVGLDFIFYPDGNPADCIREFKNFLVENKKIAILSYFDKTSKALPLLCNGLTDQRSYIHLTTKIASYLKIEGSWQEYLQKKTYRFRTEYKKKRKMMEADGRLDLLRSTAKFKSKEILSELNGVLQHSWQGQKGLAVLSSEKGFKFYQGLLEEWGPRGYVDISVLHLNDQALAYLVGFKVDKHFYFFDTAYDERFRNLSPGMVMHNMLLEQLFTEGIEVFDFGYDANYKKRWTEETLPITDLTIFPKDVPGTLLYYAQKAKQQRQRLTGAKQ